MVSDTVIGKFVNSFYIPVVLLLDENGRTGRLILNFELFRNNMSPIVIPKDESVKYFGMLAAQNSQALAEFFKELCQEEQQRIEALAG